MSTKLIKISAVIITFNEEKNIERCISSLENIADEILVVDSFSSDNTKDICLRKNVRFIENAFEGHIQQKNFAMQQAKYDYVLSLDADEELDEKLQEAILKVKSNPEFKAYTINRLTNYCGKWIKHSGWSPDIKIRLWNRNYGKWGGVNPHDKVEMQENIKPGKLAGKLLHYSFYSIDEHKKQIEKFTTISSKADFDRGIRGNYFKAYFKPVFKFIKSYFLQFGFLDGYYGFVVCKNSAFAKHLKQKKIMELQNK